jgi:site-specific DNA recombinase
MEVCLQFAMERDWNVVGVYQDTSASGATLERTQLQRMIKDACAKQFDIVAVYSADRLARSMSNLLLVEKQFRAIGVELVSVVDKTTLHILVDKMIASIRSLFSDYLERPVNSEDAY